MRNILIIGAGRSSSSLIKYLLDKSYSEDLFVTVADISQESTEKRINRHPNAKAIKFDVFDQKQRTSEIQKANIIVSMLPEDFTLKSPKTVSNLKTHGSCILHF